MPRFLVKKKAEVIAEYKISALVVVNIGSIQANEIYIPGKNVSENHCTITKVNDTYEIKDNHTLSGTLLNGKQITISELKLGDEIAIGNHTVLFLPDARSLYKTSAEADSPSGDFKNRNYFLLGIFGKFEGKKFLIKNSGTFIGREKISPKGIENYIVLTGDMTVSKGHARVELKDNAYYLKDVGSTGGVAVNGKKVGQLNEIQIHSGDEIAIGRTIFRFVEDGNDNYALPKNHHIFLLKIRGPLISLLTLLTLSVSTLLIYTGITGIKISESSVRKISLDIENTWVPSGNAIRNIPEEYDISASAAIGDMNKDGINDIVSLNPVGFLYCWDGKTGGQIWKAVEIFNSGKSSPALCDMNKDGILDVILLSDTSMIYIVDGQSGGVIRKEVLGGAISDLSPAVGDLDGDGKPDAVVCAEDGMVHFVYAPGFDSNFEKYTEFIEGPIYASPVILATDRISPMVIVCGYNSKVFFFDGKNRTMKTVELVEKSSKAHLITASPAIGDLNGDGIPEVVVQSNIPQYVSSIDITSFGVNWTYFVEPVPPSGLKHNSSPVVTDVNGDGLGDVVFVSANGYLYALKGKTGYPAGELLSKTKIPNGGRLIGGLSLYDFDKTGLVDIAFGTENGDIIIAKPRAMSREMEIAADIKVSNDPITSSLLIADSNDDGKIEIVYNSFVNSVGVLKSNLRTYNNKLIWPMYLGSPSRSGSREIREDKKPFLIRLAAGSFLFLLLLVIYFIRRNRRLKKRPKVVYL